CSRSAARRAGHSTVWRIMIVGRSEATRMACSPPEYAFRASSGVSALVALRSGWTRAIEAFDRNCDARSVAPRGSANPKWGIGMSIGNITKSLFVAVSFAGALATAAAAKECYAPDARAQERAFSRAVTTEGGKVIWLGGQTGSPEKSFEGQAREIFDALEK